MWVVGNTIIIVCLAVVKTSIGATLLRIATNKWHKLATWFVIVTVCITKALSVVFMFASCQPPRARWDPSHCWDMDELLKFWRFSGGWRDWTLSLLSFVSRR